MKFSLEQKIVLGLGTALALLLGIGFISYRSTVGFLDTADQVSHTHEVLESLERVLSLTEELETGQRGYLITGEEAYLEPFQFAVRRMSDKLTRLRELTKDNAPQQARLDRLEQLWQHRQAFAEQAIAIRQARGFNAARELLLSGRGQEGTDEIRRLVKEMKDEERSLLAARSSRANQEGETTLIVIGVLSGIAVMVVFSAGLLLIYDLSGRRKAEQSLRKSQARQDLILGTLPLVMYSAKAGADFGAQWVSDSIVRITGFPTEQFLQDSGLWVRQLHPDDRERVMHEFSALLDSGSLTSEYRWRVADGSYRWFVDRAVLVRNPDRTAKEIVGLWTDVTDRKGIEEMLRQVNQMLTALIQASPIGITVLDPQGNSLLWNSAAERIFGWRKDEVLGRPLPTISPGKELEHKSLCARVLNDNAFTELEVVRQRKDGSPISISLSTAPLRDSTGAITGILGLMADISGRKRAELELGRSLDQLRALATRLETIREEERSGIAREIHDELGQALTSLKLDVAWVQKHLAALDPDGERARISERLRASSHLLDTTIQTVRRIATMLRPGVLDELGLQAAIEWQTREFQTRSGVRCLLHIASEMPPVTPDQATTLFRIFQEILTNVARHAEATTLEVHLAPDGDWAVLEVHDDGRGITEAEMNDVKALGLLGMRERASQLGGTFRIRGAPGKGTTVTVRLPLTALTGVS